MFFTFNDLEQELLRLEKTATQPFKYQFDSRCIEKGNIFIALKGQKFDGHDFLKEVTDRGAFGAIVEKDYQGSNYRDFLSSSLILFQVEGVVKAIQFLAKKKMEREKSKIISITGSVGKTTTKEFTYNLLSEKFIVSRNPKSFNSQRGLALSILNMPQQQDILLLELGISEKGEMEKLSNIVKPDIALFTPIGLAHAEHFEGVEEIVQEKVKVLDKRTKLVVAPFDLLKYKDIFPKIKTITYSIKEQKADYFLFLKNDKIVVQGRHGGTFPKIFEETHFLENFLASYIIGKELGLTNEDIEKRMPLLKAAPLRFEKIVKDGVLYIQDCYNANALSTCAALENLPTVKGKKIAVLGEMKELGKYSQLSHEMVGELAAQKIDILLCFGKETKHILQKFREGKNLLLQKHSSDNSDPEKNSFYFDDLMILKTKLYELIEKDDLVLIKGSRFLQLERLLEEKK